MLTSQHPDSPTEASPLPLWIAPLVTACVVLAAAVATLRPLLSHTPWMLFLEDDFFYYLKVASNLAHGHGSTFNGIVPTNGYHPLWLLLLTVVCAVSTAPKFILGFVAIVIFLASISTYLLTRRLLTLARLSILPACALAAYATVYSMHVFFGGMEVILTIPLVLLVVLLASRSLLWQAPIPSIRSFLLLGLATSAMILSRLDTLLLAVLLGLGILTQRELRARLLTAPALTGLSLGLLPTVLYFLSNLVLFGTLLPISGMAKQLKTTYSPSPIPWASAFHRPPSQLVNFVPILLAIALILIHRRSLTSVHRALFLPVLAFPFLYIALLSVRSDWQLWGWYLYPFRTAFCISLVALCAIPGLRRLLSNRIVTVVLILVALVHLPSAVWRIAGRENIYAAAVEIQGFALTHPGIYAMGDRSGMVAWLIHDPVIQTEGLVMDKTFLGSIRTRQPLLPVLAQYDVLYYIGTAHQPFDSGCFNAVEPAQAGPASPHMLADLCQAPLATFGHEDWYNGIFDLRTPSTPAR